MNEVIKVKMSLHRMNLLTLFKCSAMLRPPSFNSDAVVKRADSHMVHNKNTVGEKGNGKLPHRIPLPRKNSNSYL